MPLPAHVLLSAACDSWLISVSSGHEKYKRCLGILSFFTVLPLLRWLPSLLSLAFCFFPSLCPPSSPAVALAISAKSPGSDVNGGSSPPVNEPSGSVQ